MYVHIRNIGVYFMYMYIIGTTFSSNDVGVLTIGPPGFHSNFHFTVCIYSSWGSVIQDYK